MTILFDLKFTYYYMYFLPFNLASPYSRGRKTQLRIGLKGNDLILLRRILIIIALLLLLLLLLEKNGPLI